jgi:hypothetical protein
MMKSFKLLALFCASFCVVVAAATLLFYIQTTGEVRASTVAGNDYQTYEITASTASTSPIVIKSGSGSFGSIVIASTTTSGVLRIYDHNMSTTSATSTRVVAFQANASLGTYTFDRDLKYGIVIDVPAGFTGSYVLTYR